MRIGLIHLGGNGGASSQAIRDDAVRSRSDDFRLSVAGWRELRCENCSFSATEQAGTRTCVVWSQKTLEDRRADA